jgi:hypothetical protein
MRESITSPVELKLEMVAFWNAVAAMPEEKNPAW